MKKCRVLFLSANPTNAQTLHLDEETREIRNKIRAAEYRDTLEFIPILAVRAADLQQALLEYRPHIVHFSGHGTSSAEIVLKDQGGEARPVSKEALTQTFKLLKDRIRLVILNSCFSAPQAEAIVEVIDCAIGMKAALSDKAAITFTAAFYRAIGFGQPIQTAFDLGKNQLALEGFAGHDIPELLSRTAVDPSSIQPLDRS